MRVPAGLRALASRDYRLFWAGQAVSVVGSWMQSVALSWLVLELTGSPLRLGIVSALQFGPLLFFSLVAGVVIDRFERRRVVLATQLSLMAPALVLAALTGSGRVRYWHVALLAGVIGIVNALDMPARQSFVAEVVPRDDVMSAITLNSATFNMARVVGPALGGVLIARFGLAAAFLANALSFLTVVCALLLVRTRGRPPAGHGVSVAREIADGVLYAARTPRVALVLGLVVVMSVFVINHGVLVPLLARDVLHEGVHGLGFLMASLGAGAVLGAVGLAGLGQSRPTWGAIVGPALAASILLAALGAVRVFWVAAVLVALLGSCQIVFLASCNTTLQLTAPDHLRGRVISLYTLAFAGMTPFGALLTGSMAEAFGVPATCLVGGTLGLLLGSGFGYFGFRGHGARSPANPGQPK